jgi:exonuclease III
VLLLQELKISKREALSFTLPGFQGIAKARNPKGGGVAVLVRDTVVVKGYCGGAL